MISGTTTVKGADGDFSKSELEVVVNRTDNGKLYRCEAKNPAMASAKVASRRLRVRFRPDRVAISVEPSAPAAGKRAVLRCRSGSSNPTARISWRYKGERLAGTDERVEQGNNGGNITTNILEVWWRKLSQFRDCCFCCYCC